MAAHDAGGVPSAATHLAGSSQTAMPGTRQRFWPEGWWRLSEIRLGIVPLPLYILLIVIVAALVDLKEIKPDGPTMILVLLLGGFTCAEIGKHLPLAFYHLIPAQMEKSIIDFSKSTNCRSPTATCSAQHAILKPSLDDKEEA
uniref:Uncharacterized protein n=1 Tax=Bosea sp. NBC_00436 TaxID=2969620 RepID=A0A9E7ZQ92_9HYPH